MNLHTRRHSCGSLSLNHCDTRSTVQCRKRGELPVRWKMVYKKPKKFSYQIYTLTCTSHLISLLSDGATNDDFRQFFVGNEHTRCELLHNPSDQTSCHGPASFADVKALTGFDCERVMQFTDHFDVVTRHDHLVFLVSVRVRRPVKGSCFIYFKS